MWVSWRFLESRWNRKMKNRFGSAWGCVVYAHFCAFSILCCLRTIFLMFNVYLTRRRPNSLPACVLQRFEQLTLCIICYFSDIGRFLRGYFSVIVKMSYDSIIGPVSTILAMAEGMLTLIWTALVSATFPLSFLGSSLSPRAR